MKKMILAITVLGTMSFGSYAQTNRNYNTDMQTKRMYEDERRGGKVATGIVRLNVGTDNQEVRETPDKLQMNTVQVLEGYKSSWESDKVQRCFGAVDDKAPAKVENNTGVFGIQTVGSFEGISRRQVSRAAGMDTSLTNGHCIGCGSRASWLRGHSYNPETDVLIFRRR